MPVRPTFPGVYIEEVPSGVRTITGVATSIAAFIDTFQRGALNVAVQLLSAADFEREFGGLDTNSEASYAIQQFFLNGGTEAWVVRADPGAPLAPAGATLPREGAGNALTVAAGRRIRGQSYRNPGAWGNSLRLEIDYDTADPVTLFNLAIQEVQMQAGRPVVVQTETFRNLSMVSGGPADVIQVVNEGSRLIQLTLVGAAALPRPRATGTLGAAIAVPLPALPANGAQFSVTVDPGGGPVGPTTATLQYGTTPPTDYPSFRPFLEAAIRAVTTTNAQVNGMLSGATVKLLGNGSVALPFRLHVLLGRGGPQFTPDAKLTFGDVGGGSVAANLGLTAANIGNVQQYSLTGGVDGTPIGAGTASAVLRGLQVNKTGMYALEDVNLFNILCIPAAVNLSATNMQAVYSEAEAYCRSRRSFLIVDIPALTNSTDGVQTWSSQNSGLTDRNAAVYFPRLMIPDPLNNGRPRNVGASGTMAGLYAATDAARGVWKAPAGIDVKLRNISELAYKLTDAENGVLNPLGLNCLRNFPIYGIVSWGARTLEGADQLASDWKYIPVRRLALFLEESLYRGTQWVVFEPNDEPLWSQIRLNVGAFMQSLFRQGAFQGTTPKEAYFVKCDKETTTQNDINLGIVNIVVGFAPLKPAEFVIIKIQQMAGQIPV